MFPLLSTRANPLGPLVLCDRTSAYPAIMQSEKTIRGMPKRITIPPGGQFESTRPVISDCDHQYADCTWPHRLSISKSFMQMPGQREVRRIYRESWLLRE